MANYSFIANTGNDVIPANPNLPLNLAGHKMIEMNATQYNENWKLPSSHYLQRNCTTTFTNSWPCFDHLLMA
ncbi:MAG: hypothetical protein IPK10_05430 [Bacteroidetes bacterium]|nr:hypothetical protein [Bacteroidota bacterium]